MRALTLASLLLLPLCASADVPRRMTWHGRLARADGSPETNPQTLKFALYTEASGGAQLWTETLANVPVINGVYAVVLGQATPLPASVVNGQDLYLGLSLNGGAEQQPRIRVASVPYALAAADAHTLQGRPGSDFALAAHTHPNASDTAAGFMSSGDKKKLDGIETFAFATFATAAHTHPYAPLVHGHDPVSDTAPGFMTATQKTKLDGLNSANYAPASHVTAMASSTADGHMSKDDKAKLDGLNSVNYAPASHTHAKASASVDGFMSKEDFSKLKGYPATPPAAPALSCKYRRADATGIQSTATVKCDADERLTGSSCATKSSTDVLLAGSEPVVTTTDPSGNGSEGVNCTGAKNLDFDNGGNKTHAWAFCCKL